MGLTRKGDNWFIDYYAGGRRKREKIGASKKLAERVLAKRKTEIAENRYLDIKKEKNIPFQKLTELYLSYARTNKKSYSNDIHYMKKFIEFFGDRNISGITPLMVEQFKAARKDTISEATINRYLSVLKHMFNKGIEWGLCESNPVKKVKLFKENNSRIRYLEFGEMDRLLDNCADFLKPVILTALNTGMRQGEILNLTTEDVDLKRKIIYIRQSKSGEHRECPINSVLSETFQSLEKNPKTPHIFLDNEGQKLGRFVVRYFFEKAVKQAGIEDFHFHDMRHTFASHLVMAGVDIMTVKELLGHKTLKMTLRYSHLSPNHKSAAVETLGATLRKNMDTFWTLEGGREEKGVSAGIEKSLKNDTIDDNGQVAERLIAPDCKSGVLGTAKVRILPCPF